MKSEANNTDTVTISRSEYEDLQEMKKQYQWVMEQLRVNPKKIFGSSSEKAVEGVYEQLSLLFNETEAIAQEESISKIADIPVRSYTRKRKTGSVHDILPRDAEVVEITHTLPEEERTCPECGSVMEPIGKEVVEKVVLVPAKAVLQRDIYYTYACKQCTAEPTPIKETPKEPVFDSGELCFRRSRSTDRGTEVRHGCSVVPAGTGMEPTERTPFLADHVELVTAMYGRLVISPI